MRAYRDQYTALTYSDVADVPHNMDAIANDAYPVDRARPVSHNTGGDVRLNLFFDHGFDHTNLLAARLRVEYRY